MAFQSEFKKYKNSNGNLYKAVHRLRECNRQVEAVKVSNSRNKIHQTREQPYRDSLYICGQYPSSQRECPNVNEFNVCWVIQRLISYLTPKRTLLSSSFRRAHHLGRKRRRRDAAFCSASDFFSLLKNVSFDSSKKKCP